MKAAIGGRVRVMVSGSAPLSAKTINFLKICFCCPLQEGYGLTETLAVTAMDATDHRAGLVGGLSPAVEMKLVDVPDMKYLSSDKPYPRGEICFRGNSIFKGYFRQPDKTKEVLDENGWFHTGDIGEIHEGGTLKIIDRKKNIFKLSQGEYIAPEKLEQAYLKSKYIGQIFIHGEPTQNFIVAFIVPD